MTPGGRRERAAHVALADPASGVAVPACRLADRACRLAAATGAPMGRPSTEWPHDLEERLEVDGIGMVDRVRHLVDHDLFKQLALALAR
jgi:hypothetical protein